MYDYDIHCIDKTADYGVFAKGLGKRFDDFWALKDLDLAVPKGSVLGLLGHNGAICHPRAPNLRDGLAWNVVWNSCAHTRCGYGNRGHGDISPDLPLMCIRSN